MADGQSMTEITSIAVAVVFLGVSLLIVWVVRSVLGVEGQAVLVTLMVIPVIVYVIVSGKIKEFRSPWGSATFQAGQPVAEALEVSDFKVEMATAEDIRSVARGDDEKLEKLRRTQPALLTLELGKEERYGPGQVREYVEVLSESPNFRSVVFVNPQGQFEGSMPAETFVRILDSPRGEQLIEAVNSGEVEKLMEFPGVSTTALSGGATSAEALRAMDKVNRNSLVVVDDNERPSGIAERSKILSHMIRPEIRQFREIETSPVLKRKLRERELR